MKYHTFLVVVIIFLSLISFNRSSEKSKRKMTHPLRVRGSSTSSFTNSQVSSLNHFSRNPVSSGTNFGTSVPNNHYSRNSYSLNQNSLTHNSPTNNSLTQNSASYDSKINSSTNVQPTHNSLTHYPPTNNSPTDVLATKVPPTNTLYKNTKNDKKIYNYVRPGVLSSPTLFSSSPRIPQNYFLRSYFSRPISYIRNYAVLRFNLGECPLIFREQRLIKKLNDNCPTFCKRLFCIQTIRECCIYRDIKDIEYDIVTLNKRKK